MDRRKVAPKSELAITEAWGSPAKSKMAKTPSPSSSAYTKCSCCPYGYHIDVDFVRYCEALANEKYVRQLKQLHKDRRKQRKSMEILLGHRSGHNEPQGQVTGQYNQNYEQNNEHVSHQTQQPAHFKQHLGHLSIQNKPDFELQSVKIDPQCQYKQNNGLLSQLNEHEGFYVSSCQLKEPNERFKPHLTPQWGRDESDGCLVSSINHYAHGNRHYGHNFSVYPPDVVSLGRQDAGDSLKDAVDDFEEAYRVSTLDRKRKNRHTVDLLNVSGHHNSLSLSSSSDSDTCVLLSNDEDLAPAGRYRSDSLSSLSTISTIHNHNAGENYPNSPSTHMENTLASFDRNSVDVSSVNGPVSPSVLQNIRQQMAVSLQRMKELEEQAKAVPVLQVKLAVLKEEKRLLMLQLKAKDRPSVVDESLGRKFRSVGVNCSALTRDVSVNHVPIETKTTAVDAKPFEPCFNCLHGKKKHNLTVELVGVDSIEPKPCSECLNRQKKIFKTTAILARVESVSKSTETNSSSSLSAGVQVRPQTKANHTQTVSPGEPKAQVQTRNVLTETDKVLKKHFSCLFQPETADKSTVCKEEPKQTKTISVECNISVNCDKCSDKQTKTTSTNTQPTQDMTSQHLSQDSTSSDSSEDEEEEGSSPDEASYDSVLGTITHECGDDEAIRQGRPGAVMFTPKLKLTLTDAIKESFVHLNRLLEQSSLVEEDDEMRLLKDEWFKASSQKESEGQLVEEWLDAMEAVSPDFLAAVVNQADLSGNTALHYAISHSNFDVVSLLLDSKVCDVNKSNKAGYNALMLSSLVTVKESSHLSVLKRLFKLSDVNAKAAQHGQTALMLAASHGKVDMVRILHEAGADVNIQDKDGSSALMCASEHGHIHVVRYLLAQQECQPNLVDNDGCNALSIAIEAGHKDIGLLIYAQTSLSRGSSPSSSMRRKSSSTYSNSSSPLPTPPYSPAKSRKSTSSLH